MTAWRKWLSQLAKMTWVIGDSCLSSTIRSSKLLIRRLFAESGRSSQPIARESSSLLEDNQYISKRSMLRGRQNFYTIFFVHPHPKNSGSSDEFERFAQRGICTRTCASLNDSWTGRKHQKNLECFTVRSKIHPVVKVCPDIHQQKQDRSDACTQRKLV